jgi:DNA-binding PadR family transcriptional regulator
MSTKEERKRAELLLGPTHGHAIAKTIEFNSQDVLQVEQGSLQPALHRLIKRGWISAEEGTSENNRRAKFYNLTPKRRRQWSLETRKGTSWRTRSREFCGRRNRRANHEAAQAHARGTREIAGE